MNPSPFVREIRRRLEASQRDGERGVAVALTGHGAVRALRCEAFDRFTSAKYVGAHAIAFVGDTCCRAASTR